MVVDAVGPNQSPASDSLLQGKLQGIGAFLACFARFYTKLMTPVSAYTQIPY